VKLAPYADRRVFQSLDSLKCQDAQVALMSDNPSDFSSPSNHLEPDLLGLQCLSSTCAIGRVQVNDSDLSIPSDAIVVPATKTVGGTRQSAIKITGMARLRLSNLLGTCGW